MVSKQIEISRYPTASADISTNKTYARCSITREVMCIMEYQEAEWLDFDQCSLEGLEIPAEETVVSGTPILLPEDRPAVWQ